MMIIGVDYHPSFQTIAFLMEETGEYGEQELKHSDGEAERFYRDLKQRGIRVRVGMEATGYSRWFERLLAELGFEVWIGDPAMIKTKRVKKQKTDREDARLLLRLMREGSFPQTWVPTPENRDLRQLLWHRHRMVQMRTRIMNQLQALEIEAVEPAGAGGTGEACLSALGQPSSSGVVGVVRPDQSNHRGIDRGSRTRSPETSRRAATDYPSWRRPDYGSCLRVGYRNTGAVPPWQTDWHLPGDDSE